MSDLDPIIALLDTSHPATIKALDPETYPFAMPTDCLYGWLGAKARTLGGPLGWGYTGLLAVFASYGVQVQGDSDIRPTLYVAHMADKGVGKSRIQDRIMRSMCFHTDTVVTTVPGSDRGLYEMFEAETVKNGGPITGPPPCRVLVQDEMLHMLQKLNIQGSALGMTLCTLWDKDEVSGATKGHVNKARVRLSILGAVKAKDPGEFRSAFAVKTGDGFADRFILVPGPTKWRWTSIWKANMEKRIPTPVSIPDPITLALERWEQGGDSNGNRGRLGYMAMRIAVISASANGDREVTPECLQAALRLAEWQETVRKTYSPSVALNEAAMLTELALSELEALDEKTPGQLHSWRAIYKKHNWARKFSQEGVNRCFRALIEGDQVIAQRDSKEKPTGQIRIRRD